jgi:putative ABC transport system permease protein
MGMPIVEGRGFRADDHAGTPMVAVVNRTLVKRYFAGASPIGTHVGINGSTATIVGLIDDVHHFGPASSPTAEMYIPYVQLAARMGWLVVHTKGDPAALAPALRQAMREVDPGLPLAAVRPITALAAASVAQPRFLAALVTLFSVVATALALTGVYGLIAFAVSRRTREIGVRMALGSSRRRVLALILGHSLLIVFAGVSVGAALGAALSHVIRSLLFGVKPGDPATVAGVAGLIVAASLAASLWPARRAALVDPVVALRDE